MGKSKACVIGCGSIGCLIAYYLDRALEETITVIVRRKKQKELLGRFHVKITGLIHDKFNVRAYLTGELPEKSCEYGIVATKAYDAVSAVSEALRISKYVAVASNGFGGLEAVSKAGGLGIGILVEYGVTRDSDTSISLRGEGRFVIGPYNAPFKIAQTLAAILDRGGARVVLVKDIEPFRWAKAAVNAGLNGVATILGVENGIIVKDVYARQLALRAAQEVADIAKAIGVKLPLNVSEYLLEIAAKTKDNKNSMLQDIESGRRTEIEEIHGYIIRKAKEIGYSANTLEHLYMLVKAIEGLGGRICRRERK